MLSLSSTLRIFLATEPADMRKGFDGLSQLVRDRIAQDPLSGHLYVFRNRRRDRIKILYWDRDGFALWYKNQTTDFPSTDWWHTLTGGAHNQVAGTDPPRGLVPGSSNEHAPRRLAVSRRTKAAVPPAQPESTPRTDSPLDGTPGRAATKGAASSRTTRRPAASVGARRKGGGR